MTTRTATMMQCPACGKKAKRVGTVTLRALVKDEFARQFGDNGPACCQRHRIEASSDREAGCSPITVDTGWRFCDSPDCDVVYISEEAGTTFTKSQLSVPVGVKETAGDRPLCYCFGHSVASIKEELRAKGRSNALDDIRAKMKDPGCRCETENPSGACCLGSVAKGITIAKEELNMVEVIAVANAPTEVAAAESRASRGETIAKVGTLVSATMASSCCWLPLLLLAGGVSGAGIASALEAYRPVFIVVTFGFLAAAFYFTYRPKGAMGGGARACCATDADESEACCAPASKGRFNMMSLNKAMLWAVAVVAVVFLLFPSYVGTLFGSSDQAAITANMNQAVFKIEGMTCAGCATVAEKALRDVSGVLAVEVNYEKGEAVIGSEACCPLSKDKIHSALKQVGYRGSFAE